MRRRISIRGCGRPSVRPSPVIFSRVLGASCAVYPALFSYARDCFIRQGIFSSGKLFFHQARDSFIRQLVFKSDGRRHGLKAPPFRVSTGNEANEAPLKEKGAAMYVLS